MLFSWNLHEKKITEHFKQKVIQKAKMLKTLKTSKNLFYCIQSSN